MPGDEMDEVRAAYQSVLSELNLIWGEDLSELRDFCPSALPDKESYLRFDPVARPMLNHIGTCRSQTSPAFQPLVNAIIDRAPQFHWIRSYKSEHGVDADFLERYAYINLVSPAGPFVSDDTRITIAFWGAGLIYPEHWHGPEELYAVVAGSARFRATGRAPRDVGVGDFVHHESNQLHATDMILGPLLAVIGWKGGELLTPPAMDVEQTV